MEIFDLISKGILAPISFSYILVLSKWRFNFRTTFIGGAVSCAVIMLLNIGVLTLIDLLPYINFYADPLLRVLTYVEIIICVSFFTKQPLARLMQVSFTSFVLVYTAQVLGTSIRVYTGWPPSELLIKLPVSAFWFYITCLVRRRWRWFANGISTNIWWSVCAGMALITLAFTVLTSFPAPLESSPDNILPAIVLSGASAAIIAAFFYIFEGFQNQHQIEQTLMMKDFQTAALELQTKSAAKSLESFTLFRHDLNHIATLLQLCLDGGHFEEARRLISTIGTNISSASHSYPSERFLGSRLIDSTISYYCHIAKSSGITTNVSVGAATTITVNQAELVVALSNALECAIIACRPLDEGKRRIHITGHQQTRSYFLEIAGTCPSHIEIDSDSGMPVSGDPGVSIGWESIARFSKKYSMRLRYQRDDDWLVLQMQI